MTSYNVLRSNPLKRIALRPESVSTYHVSYFTLCLNGTRQMTSSIYVHGVSTLRGSTVLTYLHARSRIVSVLDSGAEGPGFKSQSRRCRVTVLTVHTHRASVHQAAKLVAALLRVAGVTTIHAWRKVMAAYRRVYDSHHLQADCQEPGSAQEP